MAKHPAHDCKSLYNLNVIDATKASSNDQQKKNKSNKLTTLVLKTYHTNMPSPDNINDLQQHIKQWVQHIRARKQYM